MDRPCTPKGQQLKYQNCANLGKEDEEGQGTPKGQGTPGGVQRRKREKNWGGTVGEKRRLLPATDVSGVFCCTASCDLRGTERKSK